MEPTQKFFISAHYYYILYIIICPQVLFFNGDLFGRETKRDSEFGVLKNWELRDKAGRRPPPPPPPPLPGIITIDAVAANEEEEEQQRVITHGSMINMTHCPFVFQ